MATFTPGMIIEPGVIIQPVAYGEAAFTTAGTYSWIAPDNVFSVNVVAVGAGGGSSAASGGTGSGGGGALGWKNNISVVPGQTYTVVVGAPGTPSSRNGGNSYFIDLTTVAGYGGTGTERGARQGPRSNFVGDGGGQGGGGCGNGDDGEGLNPGLYEYGGGGAGGYLGNGGNGGGGQNNSYAGFVPDPGSGGGGGGGSGRAGGSVGIGGAGATGTSPRRTFVGGNWIYYPGTPGSGGSFGSGNNGGNYGAGGAGSVNSTGGSGAVRIIWGQNRAFPSTNTQA